MMAEQRTISCYHCGLDCGRHPVYSDQKAFCCKGCRTAYDILSANDLAQYYTLNVQPGTTPVDTATLERFAFLDDDKILNHYLNFKQGNFANTTLHIPAMHCSSCIWLLENLYRIQPGITVSKVDFLRKQINISFNTSVISFREIIQLLTTLGYEPELSKSTVPDRETKTYFRKLYVKIGIAGFAFANIMLLSLPDYFAGQGEIPDGFIRFFGFLNILLSIPVMVFSASEFLVSGWRGFKSRTANMDIPISIGILVLFLRSLLEILSGAGQGWMDSLSGLVFFLLLGRLFQEKTYQALSFDQDYRSYLPLSVMKKEGEWEVNIPIGDLTPGDRVYIRNNEIIPADSILMTGDAQIDYSFITGEDTLQKFTAGDMLYAGGRQSGNLLEMKVVKPVDQSYLTQLWDNDTYKRDASRSITGLADTVAKYFTAIILTIALVTFFYWFPSGWQHALTTSTAVLIIACPCALALTIPFTFGTTMRLLGRHGFYLKNTRVIEYMVAIDRIIFDKTGTLTESSGVAIRFEPEPGEKDLSRDELVMIRSLVRHSTHPLSRKLVTWLPVPTHHFTPRQFEEISGRGLSGIVDGRMVKIGSAEFAGTHRSADRATANVSVSIEGTLRGSFHIKTRYRTGLRQTLEKLGHHYKLDLLSGDNDREAGRLRELFPHWSALKFFQSPEEKRNHVFLRQEAGEKIMMVGDGINDAGALRQSDVGMSISENIHAFSPASDILFDARHFSLFPEMLTLTNQSIAVVKVGYGISFLYNIFGISFAVKGYLSPLVAAILMPVSSITVVTFATVSMIIIGKFVLSRKRGD
ncbi:MAG: heavy metal translocating P-type ATPase [Fidelibacterota bacterium]